MIHMDKPSLEIINTSPSPLQEIYQERVIDWRESQDHINTLVEKHHEKYRQRVCVKCSDVQKIKRNCAVADGLDSNGNPKTYCNYMSHAGYRKHKDLILKSMDFHPLFYNPE